MPDVTRAEALYEQITARPVIDVHSHLHPNFMAARRLEMVIFYHMLRYPLRAAGADEATLWPGNEMDANGKPGRELPITLDARTAAAFAQLPAQGFGRGLRMILRDLYNFDAPLTPETLPALQAAFTARTTTPGWGRRVLEDAGVRRVLSGMRDHQDPDSPDNDFFHFTVENAPGNGIREFTGWPARLAKLTELYGPEITNYAALRALIADFHHQCDWSRRSVYVAWESSYADFTPVDDAVVDGLIDDARHQRPLSDAGRATLEGAFIRATCAALRGRIRIFQLCYGTQYVSPGPTHPVVRSAPGFAASLGYLVGDFPDMHFNFLSSAEQDEQALCALCQAYGNASLGGFWYYNFYPHIMQQAWQRRLDMVPLNRLCGFFSDGYCVDWIYARLRITQRVLANVLAQRIADGWCTEPEALHIVDALLDTTPRELFALG